MKLVYLAIFMAVILAVPCSFAQLIDTSQTPTQSAYQAGFNITPPGTQTPSQQAYEAGLNRPLPVTGTPSQQIYQSGLSPMPVSGTPSQQIFKSNLSQPSPAEPIPAYNVAISDVLQDGNALEAWVANNGTAPVNLAGWALVLNNGSSTYAFPNFALQPTAVVAVHSRKGTNTLTDLYGSDFMWAGTRDVELVDNNGLLVSEWNIA